MPPRDASNEKWDYYPCTVDDARASIFLDRQYEKSAPVAGADTIYWLRIHLRDKGAHGMGSADEAEVLEPIEDKLTSQAQAIGLVYVGRLRTDGKWELTFYGPASRLEKLQKIASGAEGLGGRKVETGSKPDSGWNYYLEFLRPDAERRRWMIDRDVVEALEEHGDVHEAPRRVDHWAEFPTAEARNTFIREAATAGFSVSPTADDPKDELPFNAGVHRVDSVELAHIHAVVMQLIELAERQRGRYTGWETSVEAAPARTR